MNQIITRLINYAKVNLYLKDEDSFLVTKRLCSYLGCNVNELENVTFIDSDIRAVYEDLYKLLLKNKSPYAKRFDECCDDLMDIITPFNSTINYHFEDCRHFSIKEGLEFFYNLNLKNNFINNVASFQDEWIDYKDKYNFRYVLEDSHNLNIDANNRRELIFRNSIDKTYFFFNRSENIPLQFELKTHFKDFRELLNKEFEFLNDVPSMFVGNFKGKVFGGTKELNFFEHKELDKVEHPFFKGTSIAIYENKFNTLKLTSNNIEDVIETIFYVENAWKALDSTREVIVYLALENNNYVAYVVLLNKTLDSCHDQLFIKNLHYEELIYLGQVILDEQIKKDISKLANLLSDESFDLDWYLDTNPELKSYEILIKTLIDRKTQKLDKNEAMSQIQNEISYYINQTLCDLVAYNNSEEFINFLNMLK